jgi:hypothetical protein
MSIGPYDRRIDVVRTVSGNAVGRVEAYRGQSKTTDATLFRAVPASIQESGQGSMGNRENLPTDERKGEWKILIPKGRIPAGGLQRGDRLTDDLGRVFSVLNEYPNFLGWKLRCERLTA